MTELLLEGSFFGDPGGEYFGRDTCVRYFLAVPRQELRRSLSRMKQVLAGRR